MLQNFSAYNDIEAFFPVPTNYVINAAYLIHAFARGDIDPEVF
jgi:hypothetical protein